MRGHIRERGNGWSIVYDERPDPTTGQRRQRERGGFRTKSDAEKALNAALAAIESGRYVRPDRLTVRELLSDWVEQKAADDVKPTTASSYRGAVRRVVEVLGSTFVQELDVRTVNNALRTIHTTGGRGGRPLSLRSVKLARFVLRAALDLAVEDGVVATNVARSAKGPGKEHDEWEPRSAPREPWSVAEVRRWLGHVADDRLAAMWLLLAPTGLRRGEACGLRWAHVRLEAAQLEVKVNRTTAMDAAGRRVVVESTPKSQRSERPVTLDSATVSALRAHRARQAAERLAAGTAWQDDDRVFCLEDGTGLDPDAVSRRFVELCEDAGVRRIRLHDVRHSVATLMLEAGVPVEVLSQRLGHSRISTTMDLYVHPDLDRQRRAADAFGALLAGGEA